VKIVTVSERPDLTERAFELTFDTLREYNQHGDVLNRYWGRLTEELPEFQFHLVDEGEEILARARALPSTGMEASTTCPRESTVRSRAALTKAVRTCSARS
jgi:hypothetical protein